MGWVVIATPRPLYPWKDPVHIVYEAGWAPGPVWTGAKNPAPPPGFHPRAYQVVIPTVLSRPTEYIN